MIRSLLVYNIIIFLNFSILCQEMDLVYSFLNPHSSNHSFFHTFPAFSYRSYSLISTYLLSFTYILLILYHSLFVFFVRNFYHISQSQSQLVTYITVVFGFYLCFLSLASSALQFPFTVYKFHYTIYNLPSILYNPYNS